MKRLFSVTLILIMCALLLTSCLVLPTGRAPKPTASAQSEPTEAPSPEPTDAPAPINEEICVDVGYGYDNYSGAHYSASLKYPYLRLNEECRGEHPELESALAALSDEREQELRRLYEDAIENGMLGSADDVNYEVSETAMVRRADAQVLSVLLESFCFTGGVHGYSCSTGCVFDAATGRRLTLDDVLADKTKLAERVGEQLERFYDTDYFYDDLDLEEYFADKADSVEWVLDINGVTIFFNPYEIAPFASGTQTVTLAFAEYPELFKADYFEAEQPRGVQLSLNTPFYYDTDGNGELECIEVIAWMEEFSYYAQYTLRLDNAAFDVFDVYAYQLVPTLVTTEDGCFLYMFEQYTDDYWTLNVYDLDGGISKKDSIDAGPYSTFYPDKEYVAIQALTDPRQFTMDVLTQFLGTACCRETYHVGADGMPVREHEWYTVEGNIEFTLRHDAAFSEYDEDGGELAEVSLKKGEVLSYYRTDGESWADLKRKDGTIVRIPVQIKEGGPVVNGASAEELLDGIIFAG